MKTRNLVFLLFFVAIAPLASFAVAQGLTAKQLANNPSLVHTPLRNSNLDYRDQDQFELSPDFGLNGDFVADGVTALKLFTELRMTSGEKFAPNDFWRLYGQGKSKEEEGDR
jgi:hypothetical protein